MTVQGYRKRLYRGYKKSYNGPQANTHLMHPTTDWVAKGGGTLPDWSQLASWSAVSRDWICWTADSFPWSLSTSSIAMVPATISASVGGGLGWASKLRKYATWWTRSLKKAAKQGSAQVEGSGRKPHLCISEAASSALMWSGSRCFRIAMEMVPLTYASSVLRHKPLHTPAEQLLALDEPLALTPESLGCSSDQLPIRVRQRLRAGMTLIEKGVGQEECARGPSFARRCQRLLVVWFWHRPRHRCDVSAAAQNKASQFGGHAPNKEGETTNRTAVGVWILICLIRLR